jgi:hypothetical protein
LSGFGSKLQSVLQLHQNRAGAQKGFFLNKSRYIASKLNESNEQDEN